MQSLSTVIIESLWLDISQSWTDLLVFACFLRLALYLIKGKHPCYASLLAYFLRSLM